MMKRTYTLCRLFGIDINIHISFLLLPLLFGWAYGVRGLFVVGFVFTCVTLHELSHSLQARHFGLCVREITLFPIGGVANLRSFGARPSQELATALAGPLFNFVSAALLYVPVRHWLGASTLLHRDVIFQLSLDTWPKTFASCFWVNPMLGLFNLVPAFPMDGGRILRSVLAQRLTYQRATRIAVKLGQIFAVLFGVWGLLASPPNLLLVVIAIFIYLAASQERSQVDVRTTLEPLRVADVLGRSYAALSVDATVGQALELMLRTGQEDFPIVDDERFTGLLPRAVVIQTLRERGPEVPVHQVRQRVVPTVRPATSLLSVYETMEQSGCKTLPVVQEDGRLAGLITWHDVSRAYAVMAPVR